MFIVAKETPWKAAASFSLALATLIACLMLCGLNDEEEERV
jgi:hypothetical protein